MVEVRRGNGSRRVRKDFLVPSSSRDTFASGTIAKRWAHTNYTTLGKNRHLPPNGGGATVKQVVSKIRAYAEDAKKQS